MFEFDLDNAFENRYAFKEELPNKGTLALAGKKTKETLSATNSIIGDLDIVDDELKHILSMRYKHILFNSRLVNEKQYGFATCTVVQEK